MSFELFPDDSDFDNHPELPHGPASDTMSDRMAWAAFMLRQPNAEVIYLEDQERRAAHEEMIKNSPHPYKKRIYVHGLFMGYAEGVEPETPETPAVLTTKIAHELGNAARLRLVAERDMVRTVARLTDRQLRKAELKGLANLKFYLQQTYNEDENGV
jgi:hypothetical protein